MCITATRRHTNRMCGLPVYLAEVIWNCGKDTGLATEAVDYIHEPVRMHRVLDSLQQLPVPHVFVVRLVPEAVNHCANMKQYITLLGTHSQAKLSKKCYPVNKKKKTVETISV